MASYATYRHIELDKVGYSKKRCRNPSSEIFKVFSPISDIQAKNQKNLASRKASQHRDSFERLFGTPENKRTSKKDIVNRNPVTGDGVASWDSLKFKTPKIYKERNPITGETYIISSPASSPATSPTPTPTNGSL
ncbi:microtubule-associated protein Jupiter-like [Sitophilus oryzae]|uniref:Microtubule-associated protein Jupiter-like n=1 Tax=Sitophilus oryzae TaxID=7048 RepID=A0A6J2YMK1_SITOR|nr:microtubule-associated protein Jupiter-like [Sitophilus oryzae]